MAEETDPRISLVALRLLRSLLDAQTVSSCDSTREGQRSASLQTGGGDDTQEQTEQVAIFNSDRCQFSRGDSPPLPGSDRATSQRGPHCRIQEEEPQQ
jgi:hypothetical protein